MFQCIECPYNTLKKYNLDRHIKNKHKNLNIIDGNLNIIDGNLNNIDGNLNNIDVPNQCKECNKIYTSKSNLTAHKKICKGPLINKKECIFCQKILASKQSKDKHQNICKEKDKTTTIINNNTYNINNIDNSITYNSITNNTTIINLNLKKNNTTPFIIDLFKESGRDKNLFCSLFIDAIWSEKRNRCMIKTNMKNNFLQVLGIEDKWVNMLDKIAVCKYLVDVCHTGTDLIDQYTDNLCKRIKKEYIDKNYQYLEDMTTCNIDDKNDEENINKDFVNNYKLLQLNAYNNSKH